MSDEKDLKLEPTDGLCYNPNLPLYWDEAALKKELDRSFELCHSCRMCFKFCPSFPTLFKAVDEHGGVRALPDATVRQVVDECFQCKLCYTQCPYTNKEHHPFRLDFPRLLMRAKAIRRRKEGIPLGDHATLHFETRETMLYQVHEMLRAEGSWKRPGAVEDELEAYNPLIPDGRSLTATLMFEYDAAEDRPQRLRERCGIENHLWLLVGETAPILAAFDDAQASDGRVSSVQYVRWELDDEQARLLKAHGTVVRLRLDHPRYTASAVLSEETRRELAGDLG